MLLVIIAAAVVVGGVTFIVTKQSKRLELKSPKVLEELSDTSAEQPKEIIVKDDVIDSYISLRHLNLLLRTDENFSDKIVCEVESLLDILIRILPVLHDEYSSTEMNWVIKKISQDHLFLLITAYVKLPQEEQKTTESELFESIKALQKEASTVENLIKEQNQNKFMIEAAYLKSKYL